ncbi:MAG: hypothetical protein BWY09_02131 [Candidatus Hydrogenedentes bacterium ADurb.Bin179]|nr:MAG: hypothetical protein BWY09_02131 [Candidatus Hydrogenedentes bacterium ADurb.Bin179]
MKTVGKQRHRPEKYARDDFNDHHHAGNGNDDQGATFAGAFPVLIENVAMPFGVMMVAVHLLSSKRVIRSVFFGASR